MVRTVTDSPVLIRLHSGDRERLELFYPGQPYNKIIRGLVKAHLDRKERVLDSSSGRAPVVKEKDFE